MSKLKTIEEEYGKDFGNCTMDDLKKYPALYSLLTGKTDETNQ